MQEVVIAGASRTPMGGFQGDFDGVEASVLGGAAIAAALRDAHAETVDEHLMGCVLPAGQGQAPARQAGFKAGLGQEVPATTLNKMCGSGMKAAMMAFDQIALGHADTMVAGLRKTFRGEVWRDGAVHTGFKKVCDPGAFEHSRTILAG